MASAWIDITVPIRDRMVRWPDNPPVRVMRLLDMQRGDDCTLTDISMGVHSGTHIDAPMHFRPTWRGIGAMPLAAAIRPARVIEIKDRKSITPDELHPHRIRRGERILFKTRNLPRCWNTDRFLKDFVYLSEAAAH